MALINLFLVLTVISSSTFSQAYTKSPESPNLVIEFFRHGHRGPLRQTYDPLQQWGDQQGELTPVGMRMHFLLGAALKDQYPHLLNAYDPGKIYIRSTDLNRTIMSAYSHMYGVYNGTGPKLGDGNFSLDAVSPYNNSFTTATLKHLNNSYALPDNFQVVPVHLTPILEDTLLQSYGVGCPISNRWISQNANDDETNGLLTNDLKDVVAHLRSQNLEINSFWDMFYAGDNCITNKFQEIPLPAHIDPASQYYEDMKFAFEWFTAKINVGTPVQNSLYALNLLKQVEDYMNGVQNGTSSLEFAFLSAHDTTLMVLLSAFNITTKDCLLENYRSDKNNQTIPYPHCQYPQYASNLIFEFYNTSEPYVVFYYNGLPVSFCGKDDNKCTLKEFRAYVTKITNGLTYEDYKAICEFPEVMLAKEQKVAYIAIWVLGTLCLLLLATLVATCKIFKQKDQRLKVYSQQLILLNKDIESSPKVNEDQAYGYNRL